MRKIEKYLYVIGILFILVFILYTMTARAGEPFASIMCNLSTLTPVVEGPDLTIIAIDYKGIIIDNSESKFFDNNTGHGSGIMKIEKGKVTGSSYAKHQDPNGDYYVLEMTLVGGEYDCKFIYGTGKFRGITGTAKAVGFTKAKPISPGTGQNCSKITGTYELKQ
jgi:hypothetical protein